jgi:hypothetical protein
MPLENQQSTIVREYTILLSMYHDEIVARIRFRLPGESTQDSQTMSLREVPNLLALWRMNALLGSFAIGTVLAHDATFTIEQSGG